MVIVSLIFFSDGLFFLATIFQVDDILMTDMLKGTGAAIMRFQHLILFRNIIYYCADLIQFEYDI